MVTVESSIVLSTLEMSSLFLDSQAYIKKDRFKNYYINKDYFAGQEFMGKFLR